MWMPRLSRSKNRELILAEVRRFPRLSLRGVKLLTADLPALTAKTWQERREQVKASVTFAASGGGRASDADLDEIHKKLLALAIAHGFPADKGSTKSEFDKAAAILLFEDQIVPLPEALRDDVWAFLATVLLADVVNWRWGASPDRYRGGVRNAFQRLWMRADAFRRPGTLNPWELVQSLTEDANLQILERPGVSASRDVTRVIGETWLEMSRLKPQVPLEAVTRTVMTWLTAAEQVRPLHALTEPDLRTVMRQFFERARARH